MKDVADLVKKFKDIELNRRILNLENEVLDLSRDKRRADARIRSSSGRSSSAKSSCYGTALIGRKVTALGFARPVGMRNAWRYA